VSDESQYGSVPSSRGSTRYPSLDGKRYSLVPLGSEHHRALYRLSISEQTSFRWRYRGALPHFDAFVQTINSNVLTQFVVVPNSDPQKLVGLVVAYDANFQDGHVYLAAISDTKHGAAAAESVGLILRYLFLLWPLKKVYLESPDFNVFQFKSAIEIGLFQEEGRLKDHRYYDGRYWDYLVFAIYREEAERFLEENPWMFAFDAPNDHPEDQ
jgi:RimJ/RimL family protein N-acetyltransferase